MKHTQPYATIAPAVAAADAAEDEFVVELAGRLVLLPGGEPRVLKIFDDHDELALAFRVGFDGIEPRAPRVELDSAAWARFRRGLVLCASYAAGGQIVVARPGGWRLTVEACGDVPRPMRRTTAKLTGQRQRPSKRPRVRFQGD